MHNSPLRHFTTYRTGIIQSKAYRNLEEFMGRTLKKHNLTMMEWAMLGVVAECNKEGIFMSNLAQELDVNISHITNKCNDLIKKGMVTREISESDKRAKLVVATPGALKLAKKVERELRNDMKDWMQGISKVELFRYIKVLDKISNLK